MRVMLVEGLGPALVISMRKVSISPAATGLMAAVFRTAMSALLGPVVAVMP